jgi:chromosome segregation ATPase
MKKTATLVMLGAISMAVFCVNVHGEDLSVEIAALEQKAERIQSQMNWAQQQCDTNLENQLKPLMASIESLVKQRMELGQHIVQLEARVDELKKNAKAACRSQVKQHDEDLSLIKQQITSLIAKKRSEVSQSDSETSNTVTSPPVPSPKPAR